MRVGQSGGATRQHSQVGVVTGDGHRTIEVGAPHSGAMLAQQVEDRLVGMAVVVVDADRHDRYPGVSVGEEGRVLVARAMVGHFQYVHREQRRVRSDQGRLAGRTEVRGHQHTDVTDGGSPHHAGVVLDGFGRAGTGRWLRSAADAGGQGPPGHVASPHGLTDPRGGHRHAGGRGQSEGVRTDRRHRPDAGDPDLADGSTGQHAGDPADVVGVEVGEQQVRDGGDAEPVQAGLHRFRLATGVDHHGGARAGT